MKNLKTWDKKTWISSAKYINEINDFIIKNSKLNRHSRILDIGCGRGKITGQLKDVLKLDYKPIGIDKIKHKDIDKRIVFKKNISKFFRKNLLSYDLILIKQTIHLFRKSFIKKLLGNLIKIPFEFFFNLESIFFVPSLSSLAIILPSATTNA